MTHVLEDTHRFDAPEDDWEDRIREEEAMREAEDDRRLHERYDNNVHPIFDSFLTAFRRGGKCVNL
jgi:hypothetical protein